MFKKLPTNRAGRDFVVGDLHGCRPFLERLLDHVRFDPSNDRLLSVGDLVDRGPDSLGCLRLLMQPWFHAVRGNHEAMLLDFVWDSLHRHVRPPFHAGHIFLDSGGEWILRLYDRCKESWVADTAKLLERVKRLPLVITVGDEEERYHVVHADFFAPGYADDMLRDADIAELSSVWHDFPVDRPPAAFPEFTTRFLWSRVVMSERKRALRVPFLDGLSPTFCGHTIDYEIRSALSHICLDTGAFLACYEAAPHPGFGLSLIDLTLATVYTLNGARGNYSIRECPVALRA